MATAEAYRQSKSVYIKLDQVLETEIAYYKNDKIKDF